MKKTLVILSTFLITVIFSTSIYAQNENDALRYSLINYGGTARFSALSGAYGAVGADFSSLSQNPAGIGLYRKSEFSITPMVSSNNTTSSFQGQSNYDHNNRMYLGNVGYVYSQNMKGHAGALVQMQFGFGVNMMASFNNRMVISGFNDQNSLLTTYVDQVNNSGAPLSEWDNYGAGLAYDVDLIFDDKTNNRWAADMEAGNIQQTKSVETWGSTNETVLSAGANISDKLFLGITFAFPFIRYHEQSILTEKDSKNLNTTFSSFDRYEYLDTKGAGFNFKAGFIYMPIEYLRFGGSIHTPTNYYNMSDTYSATMTSNFDAGSGLTGSTKSSPPGYFDYELHTPFRATGSVAFILGKYGLISADYEYIDYSTANLWASSYSFSTENNTIRTEFTTANNFRVGAEFRAGIAALRGGYNFYGTPYRASGSDGSRTGYSFGIGVREKGYFADFSYNHSSSDAYYYLYNTAPPSANTIKTNAYSLTVGFRF
jgi:hypothetical protein